MKEYKRLVKQFASAKNAKIVPCTFYRYFRDPYPAIEWTPKIKQHACKTFVLRALQGHPKSFVEDGWRYPDALEEAHTACLESEEYMFPLSIDDPQVVSIAPLGNCMNLIAFYRSKIDWKDAAQKIADMALMHCVLSHIFGRGRGCITVQFAQIIGDKKTAQRYWRSNKKFDPLPEIIIPKDLKGSGTSLIDSLNPNDILVEPHV